MNKERTEPIEMGTLIGVAHAEYETEIPEIVIDPREVVLAMVRRVAKLQFPDLARERDAARILGSSKSPLVGLIRSRDWDGSIGWLPIRNRESSG